jgi:hypothetical protein
VIALVVPFLAFWPHRLPAFHPVEAINKGFSWKIALNLSQSVTSSLTNGELRNGRASIHTALRC